MVDNDTTTTGVCALCLTQKRLRRSHIIPESQYAPTYDDKHRALVFSPLSPDRTTYLQKGIRSRLLCTACERDLNDRYEKPFLKYWVAGQALSGLNGRPTALLTGIPYAAFKLFHLSVLFRAAASDHPNFSEVELGDRVNDLRRMVREGEPGAEADYPIVCSAVDRGDGTLWHDLVTPAHRVLVAGAEAIYFVFGGAQWFYFVDRPGPEIVRLALKDDGTMPVAKRPLRSIEHYRTLA